MSQDTYRGDRNKPQSLHLYSYCENDPINFIDPTGHAKLSLAGFGVQFSVSGSVKGFGGGVGLEVIFFTNKKMKGNNSPYLYGFTAGGAEPSLKNKNVRKLHSLVPKKGLKSNLSFSGSVCVFAILLRGNSKFTASDYERWNYSAGFTAGKFKAYVAYSERFICIGAGIGISTGRGLSANLGYVPKKIGGYGTAFKSIGSTVKKYAKRSATLKNSKYAKHM